MEFVPQQQYLADYLASGGREVDLVEVWQIKDSKALDLPPRVFLAPNVALAERVIRGMLRSDNGNNQYATAPADFRAVRVCRWDPVNWRIVNFDDDDKVIGFTALV